MGESRDVVQSWIADFVENSETGKSHKIFNFEDDEWLGIGDVMDFLTGVCAPEALLY